MEAFNIQLMFVVTLGLMIYLVYFNNDSNSDFNNQYISDSVNFSSFDIFSDSVIKYCTIVYIWLLIIFNRLEYLYCILEYLVLHFLKLVIFCARYSAAMINKYFMLGFYSVLRSFLTYELAKQKEMLERLRILQEIQKIHSEVD